MLFETLPLLLAHGADPRPISLDVATANLVKFFVTISLALMMSYPILAPLFPKKDDEEESAPTGEADASSSLVGWVAIGLLLVLSMAWWLARTSIVELNTAEVPLEDHSHVQEQGGQIAMWADFHAEVARIESGEVRVYLTDAYNRPIAARFFDAEVTAFLPEADDSEDSDDEQTPAKVFAPLPPDALKTRSTVSALNESYRFARMDRDAKAYRVKVSTPGWSVTLKFVFDDENGRRSLPMWCGTPE